MKGVVRVVSRRHSGWGISEVLLPSAGKQALQNSPWATLQKHWYQTARPYLPQAPGHSMSSPVCLLSQVPMHVSLQHHRDSWGVMAINSFENFVKENNIKLTWILLMSLSQTGDPGISKTPALQMHFKITLRLEVDFVSLLPSIFSLSFYFSCI